MIKLGIIIALGIVIWIFRQNIKDGILGFAFLGVLIFGVIFLVDTYTMFPIRSLIGLGTYDEIKHNPKETLSDYGNTIVDTGKGTWENINEFGDNLDDKYGTGFEKDEMDEIDEWEEDYFDEEYENDSDESNNVIHQDVPLANGQYYYKTMETDLKNELSHLTEREKSIIRGLSAVISLSFETDNYIISSIKGENYYEIKPIDTEKDK